VLNSCWDIDQHPQRNRFANDFLPPPNSSDTLVVQSLKSFAEPLKTVSIQKQPYSCIPVVPSKALPDYLIDRAAFHRDQLRTDKRKSLRDVFMSTLDGDDEKNDSHTTEESNDSGSTNDTTIDIDLDYIKNISLDEAKYAVSTEMQAHEVGVYSRFNPEFQHPGPVEETVCNRTPVDMWSAPECSQFLITVDEFTLHIPLVEPFYCTMSLYDLRKQFRMSEDFHFDLNDKSVLTGALDVQRSVADAITLAKHAILSATDRHEEIFLVLKIERVLQGDHAEVDAYCKPKQRSKTDVDRISEKARTTALRLAEYRQPFAWGMIPMFSETGACMLEGSVSIDRLYYLKHSIGDEELMELAAQIHSGAKQLKPLPDARFSFRCQELADAMPSNRVDPSSILLKDTRDVLDLPVSTAGDMKNPVVKEVYEFPAQDFPATVPHEQFMNLLYVYPQSSFFQKYRNIACEMQVRMNDGKLDAEGMKVVLGKSSGLAFASSITTQVNYHNKNPTWADEFKVMLPLSMTSTAHLFFKFYKISCKKKQTSGHIAEVIGYAVVPLYPDNKFPEVCEYDVPVAAYMPPGGYMSEFLEGKDTSQTHFRNGGQPCFRVKLALASSVFAADKHLNNFFRDFPSQQELTKAGTQYSNELLKKVVHELSLADPYELVRFMPAILNYLLELIASRAEAAYQAFVALNIMIERVSAVLGEGTERNSLLAAYVSHKFSNLPNMPVYEPLCRQWLRGLTEAGESSDSSHDDEKSGSARRSMPLHTEESKASLTKGVVQHSWFFFDLMFKSMALETREIGSLSQLDRFLRVFEDCIDVFVHIMFDHRTSLMRAKTINKNLALFMSDLFYVLDRDLVIKLTQMFLYEFREVRNDPVLVPMIFTFLRVIFDHPYFITITNPSAYSPTDSDDDVLGAVRESFLLPGILIDFVHMNMGFQQKEIQATVVESVAAILRGHELDVRYSLEEKAQIATMYLPFLQSCSVRLETIQEMDSTVRRTLLVSVIWMLQRLPPNVLFAWWKQEDPNTLADFLQVLRLAVVEFKYCGYEQRKSATEINTILDQATSFATADAKDSSVRDGLNKIESLMTNLGRRNWNNPGGSLDRNAMMNRNTRPTIAGMSPPGAPGGRARSNTAGQGTLRQMRAQLAEQQRHGMLNRQQNNTLTVNSREYLVKLLKWEGALSSLVTRTVVNCFLDLFEVHEKTMNPKRSLELCSSALELLVAVLQNPQTVKFLRSFYPTVRLFLRRYGEAIFLYKNLYPQITVLSAEIFRHCTQEERSLRSESLSILFILLANNFQAHSNLDYLSVSLSVTMTKMVPEVPVIQAELLGQVIECLPEYYLRDPAWQQQADPELSSKFKSGMDTLLDRLRMILQGQREISRQESLGNNTDPTTVEHLFMQIADAFSHMPENRIEWLKRLAVHHEQLSNFAEAANCYIAIGELEGKRQPGSSGLMMTGSSYVSPEEAVVSAYEKACEFLDKATLYESCDRIYKKLVPLYEDNTEYDKLSKAYLHLHQVHTKLVETTENEMRMLGTYFRVGFYGNGFGALNNTELIYKMPKITMLSEMSTNMRDLYSRQLGHPVSILPDSNLVNVESLDPDDDQLQVTFVTPFFDPAEEKTRTSFIAKNTNISRFSFTTPFSKSGRSGGDRTDHYRRVTILEVANPFPAVTTSQHVAKREVVVMGPVESAVEDVDHITRAMTDLLNNPPINPKALSRMLNGSVIAQVNGGIVQLAKAFLGPNADHKKFAEKELHSLRVSIRRFLQAMQRGIQTEKRLSEDKELTQHEQAFQRSLGDAFTTICGELEPLLRETKKSKMKRVIRFAVP
jgi:dedicator of cytokinesis protein 6/7/8